MSSQNPSLFFDRSFFDATEQIAARNCGPKQLTASVTKFLRYFASKNFRVGLWSTKPRISDIEAHVGALGQNFANPPP